MTFNLNNTWSTQDVRNLIASRPDTGWVLEVDHAGNVDLHPLIGLQSRQPMRHVTFEAWIAGNDYVGKAAAEDDRHVADIEDSLRRNWPDVDWTDSGVVHGTKKRTA